MMTLDAGSKELFSTKEFTEAWISGSRRTSRQRFAFRFDLLCLKNGTSTAAASG
jgi:hypothetical protein